MDEITQAKFDEKVKQLITASKKKGFAEYNEVLASFKELQIEEDDYEKIWETLDKNKIVLRIEQPEDDDIPEDELGLDDSEEIDLDVESIEKSLGDGVSIEDPVRMYLKEIGRVPLLNAEEEIELAKKMELGIEKDAENQEQIEEVKNNSDLLAEVENLVKKMELKNKSGKEMSFEEAMMHISENKILLAKMDNRPNAKIIEKSINIIADNKKPIFEGKEAAKELSQANLRLVVSIAKRYVGRGMLFLDLIQEGNLGLIKAVEKFDYRKGYKFSTYATWWIRQAITRAIADQARTIRIPVHMVETINKIVRVNRQLLQELGREPSPAEVAKQMDMSEERVREIMKISQDPVSLETPIGEEEDSHLGDFLPDENVLAPSDAAARTMLNEQLNEILDTLTERERKVLSLRFGLTDGRARTLEEVGREFNVTRERIRQIEAKALRKLRHPSRSRKIKDYLD